MTDNEQTPAYGDLRIWYVPQAPMDSYTQPVDSIEEGFKILDAIYQVALFEFENRLKPDYSNAGGVSRYETNGEGGFDWYDVDEDEWRREQHAG